MPFPYPWRVDWRSQGSLRTLHAFCVHLAFFAAVAVPALAVAAALFFRWRGRPLQVAAAVAAMPYAHYVVSRADLMHLAGAVFPLLVLIMTWLVPRGGRGLVALAAVLLASAFVVCEWHPAVRYALWPDQFSAVQVDGHEILLSRGEVDMLEQPLAVLDRHGAASTGFVALPNMPTLHALRRMPMRVWEIYMLYPRDAAFVGRELARLKAATPLLVLVSDHALDGREDRRLSRVNPRLFAWLEADCREIDDKTATPPLRLWHCDRLP